MYINMDKNSYGNIYLSINFIKNNIQNIINKHLLKWNLNIDSNNININLKDMNDIHINILLKYKNDFINILIDNLNENKIFEEINTFFIKISNKESKNISISYEKIK